ncbi:MAG: hypothetical protein IJH43_07115 [Mogibacterium sp.]|nr:hypothetical protein [Mogibacterium sp.]
MKKHLAKAAALLLALMMIPSAAFAAVGTSTANSSDTATIYLGKVLTVSQDNKFPAVRDFNFEIEAVKAWDNANKDTTKSGVDIPAGQMPSPAATTTDHHKIIVNGTKSTVTIGDFSGSANTAKADTAREKFRVSPVSIKFTKAGYYMYKVTEKGSLPAEIPGVAYDDSSYYVVVYVCNKTDDQGNTVPGVYVHDITSFRNKPDTDTQPDLTDIQNITDNGNKAASENTYENYEKTGKSDPTPGDDPETGLPTGPDKLEAYKFWNDQTTHDVVITNNVSGNLGDLTKEFAMTVTLSGLEPGVTYTTNVPAEFKTEKKETSQGADLVSATAGVVNTTGKTFTANDDGDAEFLIKLTDEEVFVMNALPAGATYIVKEHESDHIASYTVTSTSQSALIGKAQDANTTDQKSLATEEESVDSISNIRGRVPNVPNDETVTVAFNNHRNLATVTGLPYYGDFAYVIAVLIIAAAALLIRRSARADKWTQK